MAQKIVIALDAMGGDHAPDSVVRGALLAQEQDTDLHLQLYGDAAVLRPMLDAHKPSSDSITIIHTSERISSDMKPSQALRQGKDSSMRRAITAVAHGQAAAVVSAGNTGALMALAKFVLRPIDGVDRPAIASLFPTQRSECVMLDLGANVECAAENLVQFAIMGCLFARYMFDIPQPKVGLLNVGVEELKGHEELKEAAAKLRAITFPGIYAGFIEGDDIPAGTVDVVVTDGFTGNIALKTAEGMGKLMSHFIRRTFASSWLASLGYLLARSGFNRLKRRLDPRRYNGGVLLGLRGVCVKSHGGTDHEGFANAIGVAATLVRGNLIHSIAAEIAHTVSSSNGEAAPKLDMQQA